MAAAIAIAMCLGGYGGSQHEARKQTAEIAALKARVSSLQSDHAHLQDELSRRMATPVSFIAPREPAGNQTTPNPADELQGVLNLVKMKSAYVRMHVLDLAGGKLDPGFVAAFALTPSEQERLQAAIDLVRAKLAALERAKGKMTREANGTFVFTVPPLPVEGGKLYDEMMGDFADILGPGRHEAFRALAADEFEIRLGRFGLGQRTYTFSHRPGPRPSFVFHDDLLVAGKEPGSRGPGSLSSQRTFGSFESLAAYIGPTVGIVPLEYRMNKPAPPPATSAVAAP